MEDILGWDIAPEPETSVVGVSNLTFDGLLEDPGLQVEEDGGAAGCGGKLWPAGELLARYMIRRGLSGFKKVVELGAGTGLTGLAIALNERNRNDLKIYITDQENMMPLMQKNIELNKVADLVEARVLNWGEELPDYAKDPDLILAADCVYLEAAFPILEKTLWDLTETGATCLMAYKKRRKADSKFFKAMRKKFILNEIRNHEDAEPFLKDGVHLFEICRK